MQYGALEGNADVEAAIDAVTANIAEIVAFDVEEQPIEKAAGGLDVWRITWTNNTIKLYKTLFINC